MSDRVAIREVGMRDGLQSIAEIMPTETKLAWLDAEYAAGVREIEVTSFVPPKLLPQLADAEAVVRHALTLPGLTVSALIPNSRGAERGLALGVHEMNFVLSVSEGHNRSNVRRGTDELIEDFRRVVQICRERGRRRTRPRGSIAGSRPRSAARSRAMLTRTGSGASPTRSPRPVPTASSWPTRSGMGSRPRSGACSARSSPMSRRCRSARISTTRAGWALRMCWRPTRPGAAAFDASLGGLGGCPYAPGATGNIVLEDTAFMFEAMGVATGIDIERLAAGARAGGDARCPA